MAQPALTHLAVAVNRGVTLAVACPVNARLDEQQTQPGVPLID